VTLLPRGRNPKLPWNGMSRPPPPKNRSLTSLPLLFILTNAEWAKYVPSDGHSAFTPTPGGGCGHGAFFGPMAPITLLNEKGNQSYKPEIITSDTPPS